MHGRIVSPVWHNREIHRDFESWSFRKRTIYDPGSYVDVGGHGALVDPSSLQVRATRKYAYRLHAKGCPVSKNPKEPQCDVAAVDFDRERRTILVGNSEGVAWRDPDTAGVERISSTGVASIKVQDFRADLVIVAVASNTSVTAFRGSEIVAKVEAEETIAGFDGSPYIQSELVTCVRNSVRLSGTDFTLKSNLIIEDVTFFTHPRHLAIVRSDSVIHCDVRSPETTSTIVDSSCLNLPPKNCFSSVKVNCKNVNQLFVLSNDCLSVWDVRYSIQPMGVFNHYVSRSAQLLGIQTLPIDDSLFILVRSNARSTLFEFDSAFSSPSAALLGPQLQFSSPVDIGRHYWDQTGNKVPEDVWKRLSQPIAGSCIVPGRENRDELLLNSFTTTGDRFQQRILCRAAEDSVGIERTFAYGMDALALDDDVLESIRNEVEKLGTHSAPKVTPGTPSSHSIGANKVVMEGVFLPRNRCPLCCGDAGTQLEENRCPNCHLGEAAGILKDAWIQGGLIRTAEGLTEEEERRSRELLGQSAAGLAVSDAVRAVWGEVDWRVVGDAATGTTTGDANDPDEPEDNADGYDDED